MDSRAQFEKVFRNWHPDKTGPYMKNIAEYFWQESRASIEVELPEKVMVEDEYDLGHNYGVEYCEEAIIAAGISIKGESS